MTSTDNIRETALYLEIFLKALSECNIIGSYTVQFLEVRGFTLKLQADLTSHVLQLVNNMKDLLKKLNKPLSPSIVAATQTDQTYKGFCVLCGGIKPTLQNNLQIKKESLQDTSVQNFDINDLTQLLKPSHMLNGKQESDSINEKQRDAGDQQTNLLKVLECEYSGSVIDADITNRIILKEYEEPKKNMKLEEKKTRDIISEQKQDIKIINNNESKIIVGPAEDISFEQINKCVLVQSLQESVVNSLDIDYNPSPDFQTNAQSEIVLDTLPTSSVLEPEGLMCSVYTMNTSGTLELVSRVLRKSEEKIKADHELESVDRATIEINNTCEDSGVNNDQLSPLNVKEGKSSIDVRNTSGLIQEEMVVTPDITNSLDESAVAAVCHAAIDVDLNLLDTTKDSILETDITSKQFNKNIESSQFCSTNMDNSGSLDRTEILLTDVVKLGPEDINGNTWCIICEKEFPSAGSLKIHLSRVHSKVKWCYTCTKTINSDEEMKTHVLECHSDLPFVCILCGKSLRTNAHFQRHMDIHKGMRGSACEICGQTFSRPEYFREHARVHTGEKPYKCETCNKTFSRISNLYCHMRTHNTEDQKLSCNVCHKTFARTDKLKDHMIRHLQIKRYACRLCPKAYNEKRDLTKHLEKIHKGSKSQDT